MTSPTPTKEFFLSNNNLPIFKSELTNGSELRVLGSHDGSILKIIESLHMIITIGALSAI